MTITTRAGKTSALSHAELDANFTTLGLSHGDTVANLDISSLIVENDNFDQVLFKRTNQSGLGGKIIGIFQTEFSDALTAGQGTGFWTRISGSDGQIDGGSVIAKIKDYTDSNNWESELLFTPVTNASGTTSYDSVLEVSHDAVILKNTNRVDLRTPLKLASYDNAGMATLAAQDGSIVYNSEENEFQGWNGIAWVVLGG